MIGNIEIGEEAMEKIPRFAQPRFCKDSMKRARSDPNYDPTTLHIPPDEFRKLTGSK